MSDQSHDVYIVYTDFVGFSTREYDAELVKTLKEFYSLVGQVYSECLPSSQVEFLPTGDGCLLIIWFPTTENPNGTFSQINDLNVLNFIVKLHQRTRSTFAGQPLRIGVSKGNAIRYLYQLQVKGVEKSGTNFTGHAINAGQRVMDFGQNWHILASNSIFESLPRGQEYKWEEEFGIRRWLGHIQDLEIALERYPHPYLDKHTVPHHVANIFTMRRKNIGNNRPPHFTRRTSVLKRSDVEEFEEILNSGAKFYSVTSLSADEWFGDDSLLHVLLAQAANNEPKIEKGKSARRRKFQRVIIWDSDQEKGTRPKNFITFHQTAGVGCFTIRPGAARRVINTGYLKKIGADCKNKEEPGIWDEEWREFFVKPELREFWLVLDKKDKVKNAGFGKRRPLDGKHELVKLPPQVFPYAVGLFKELQKAAREERG